MQVHRVRCVDWVPQPIAAVAFSSDGSKIAVSRGNGDIELWRTGDKWYMQYRVVGSPDLVVNNLLWYKQAKAADRLFGSSINGTLFEIDVMQLKIVNSTTSGGGGVWCLRKHPKLPVVAAACEDGGIRLFEIGDSTGDSFVLLRTVGMGEARALSVAFSSDGRILYGGFADGTIRSWRQAAEAEISSTTSWRSSFRMTLENYGGAATLVWALIVLKDGTIISGDSLGHTQFWDGVTGTLIHGFNQHEGDVLTLAVNSEETCVFASGVDHQVTLFHRRVEDGAPKASWVYSYTHRAHSHDVRCMALAMTIWGRDPAPREFLVTGGIDTQLVMHDVTNFRSARPTKLAPFPRYPFMSLSPHRRCLLVQHADSLEIFQLGRAVESTVEATVPDATRLSSEGFQKVLSMKIGRGANLSCSAISPSGEFVVTADPLGVRVFRLVSDGSGGLVPEKLALSDSVAHLVLHRAVFVAGSGGGPERIIAVSEDARLHVINLLTLTVEKSLRVSSTSARVGAHDDMEVSGSLASDEDEAVSPVIGLACSGDSQWLAVGHASGVIWIYSLDAFAPHAQVPSFGSMFTSLAFHPSGSLIVATEDSKFHIYDTERGELSEWSRDHTDSLPTTLTRRRETIDAIAFNPARPLQLMLCSQKWLCAVNTFQPVVSGGKRKRKDTVKPTKATEDKGVTMVDRYMPICFTEFLCADELVVVEMPWIHVMKHFPDVLYRHKYGT